jgi:hypothetical protein
MPYELLATNRVNAIMRGLRDARELPQNLLFLNRTPLVNATDGEITADFTGNVFAADIVADNQRAVVRNTGSFALESAKLPNIKHGTALQQDMLNLMERITAGGAIRDDEQIVNNYLGRTLNNLLTGVRQTMEILRVGCALDTITWNRGGIQFTATFGTPSDLKVTPGTAWSTAATATPIADVQTQVALRREKYGQPTNRLTMTSVAFRQMIATTEFRDKAALYNQLVGVTAATFPVADMPNMQAMAGRILGMTIELYDAKYFTQSNAGTTSSATNYLADNKVIVGDTSNDNNSSVVDFANAIVTESIVAGLTGANFPGAGGTGGFGGPVYGPVGYVTLSSFDLNAPGITAWAVARCFPRKRLKTAESVLTVAA